MPFVFSCYYLLYKKRVFSETVGDYSGPYTLTELTNMGVSFEIPISPESLVFQRIDYQTSKNTDLVIGIPDKLEISWNKMLGLMGQYNIPDLLSIRPYKKLAGNDISTDDFCILNNNNRKSVLTKSQIYARLADGRIRHNHNC